MLRFALILFLAVVVVQLLETWVRRNLSKGTVNKDLDTKSSVAAGRSELVPCASCGIHIARRQAVVAPGIGEARYFCSESCRRQGLETASQR